MNKHKRKLFKLMLLVLAITGLCFQGVAFAGTPVNSDGVYRQGANGYNHAGVYSNGSVYELPGYNHGVELNTMTVFQAGETYYGPYYSSSVDLIGRGFILDTCSVLDADTTIDYTMYSQMVTEWSPGDWVSPSEVDELRCDGLVEYAYEWNNFNVWGRANPANDTGTPQHHDISFTSYVSEHANLGSDEPWIEISPIVQRGAMGTRWTTLRPRP